MAVTITIYNDVTAYLETGSLRIEDAISNRSTASFALTKVSSRMPLVRAGDPVQITIDGTVVFGGTVDDSPAERLAPAVVEKDGPQLRVEVNCTDWHQICDRVIVAEAYANATLREIVTDLWDKYLRAEGVTLATLSTGLDVNVTQAVFNYIPLTDCLDAVSAKSGFYWQITPEKELVVAPRTQNVAPWDLEADAPVRNVVVRRHREQYRNREYIVGAKAETSEQIETFAGDGERRTFTVGYPISREPSVYRNGVSETVGAKADSAANAAQWYWANDDPVLTQGSEDGIRSWPVSGAGDSDFDGDYTQEGTFGGYPCYTNDNDMWLFWGSAAGAWLLDAEKANYVDPAGAAYYGAVGESSLPAGTWTAGTGTGAAPTVGQTNTFYTMASAGSNGFNGDYVLAGTFGGQNYYRNAAGNYLYWGATVSKWLLDTALTDHAAASSAAYYGNGASLPANSWTKGDGASPAPTCTADSEVGPSVLTNSTLTTEDVLRVVYVGAFDLVLRMDNDKEVASRGVAEGAGTGIYSFVREESGLWDLGALVQYIQDDFRRFGSMGTDITFETFTAGLSVGQLLTVDLPEHSLAGDWLISEVTMEEVFPEIDSVAGLYLYRVTALSGEAVGGWVSFFRAWERTDTIASLIDGQPETIIVAADPFEKIWPEAEHPNIFYRLYPAAAEDYAYLVAGAGDGVANGSYELVDSVLSNGTYDMEIVYIPLVEENRWAITHGATIVYHKTTAGGSPDDAPWSYAGGMGGPPAPTVTFDGGDGVYPSDDLYPQFEPYYEVRYLAVYNGADNEVARRAVTTIFEYTDTLIGSMTVLLPSDYAGTITHVGWFGGDAATSELGTGILLEQVAYAYEKDALTGILFTRRDIKGWGTSSLDVRAIVSSGFWRDEDDAWGVYRRAITSGGEWPRQTA